MKDWVVAWAITCAVVGLVLACVSGHFTAKTEKLVHAEGVRAERCEARIATYKEMAENRKDADIAIEWSPPHMNDMVYWIHLKGSTGTGGMYRMDDIRIREEGP